MNKNKYFLFDCETGGINKRNSLLSLYGAVLNGNLDKEDEIHLLTKPNDGESWVVENSALEINNINLLEHAKKAITYQEASNQLHNFVFKHSLGQRKLIPVGKNITFDIKFTKKYLLDDWYRYFQHRVLDVTSIAQFLKLMGKIPSDCSCSLNSLIEHFNIPVKSVKLHTEKYDCEITLLVLKRLMSLVE